MWNVGLCGMWGCVECGAVWNVGLCGMWGCVECGAVWNVGCVECGAVWNVGLCGMWGCVECGAVWNVGLCGMWGCVECGLCGMWGCVECEAGLGVASKGVISASTILAVAISYEILPSPLSVYYFQTSILPNSPPKLPCRLATKCILNSNHYVTPITHAVKALTNLVITTYNFRIRN